MQKLLISLLLIATVGATGCGRQVQMSFPRVVHKIDIQQGNVITQDMVNQLQPGMTKRQVQFVLGTPPIDDVFHENRWDYVYTFRKGGVPEVKREHIALFFENDTLVRLEGGMRPMPDAGDEPIRESTAILVPTQERKEGVVMRFWNRITLEPPEDEKR